MKSGKDGLGYQKGLKDNRNLNTLQRPVNIKLLNSFISDFHPFHPGIEREQRNLSHKINEVLKKISGIGSVALCQSIDALTW